MARLPKKNADYFPHPSDRRDDPKVKSLRRKFRHTGYSIYTMLRELIAGADYFHLRIDSQGLEDIAGDVDEAPELVQEIIMYCAERQLFQVVEIQGLTFLTDHEMIGDLHEMLRKRKVDSTDLIRGKYSTAIISATEIQSQSNIRVESAQIKGKEIKEKIVETDGHQKNENNSGGNNTPGTETNSQGTPESDGQGKKNAQSHEGKSKPIHDSVAIKELGQRLKGEKQWLEVLMMQSSGITWENIDTYLNRFCLQLSDGCSIEDTVSFSDKKKHFRAWLPKHLSYPENRPGAIKQEEVKQSAFWFL